MKVIGYIRVSTDEQSNEGVSLEAQRERIEAYCLSKGWDLLGVEADVMSAKDCHRPGLQAALEAVRSGEVAALVVYKLDRLSRSVVDMNNLVTFLDKHSASLVSLNENIDATTAMGRAMLSMVAVFSQLERETIGERTREAMRYLKAQRRAYSRPVYGFDNVDGQLFENGHEQAIIERSRRRRERGETYEQIAAGLNDAGIPGKRGGTWTAMTVRRILLSVRS